MTTVNIEDRLEHIEAQNERIEAQNARIEAQNEAILKAEQEKKNKHKKHVMFGLEDENEARGNWSGRFDFFLSCLGYAVGLGNLWRFPYLCYKNGGGAFFIPYVIMLVFAGIPIFFMELSLGQFTSSGPITCWRYSPLFQGLGIGMLAASTLKTIYYVIILAWCFFYLFASFTKNLPWEKCSPEWSTNIIMDSIAFSYGLLLNAFITVEKTMNIEKRYGMNVPVGVALGYGNGDRVCSDYISVVEDSSQCISANGSYAGDNGACYDANGTIFALYDQKLAKTFGLERELPSAQYFDRYVTRRFYSDGLDDLGPMQWKIVLCYLLAYFLCAIALSKSIKSSGKAVYFTATFPYVLLLILLIRGLMLDGYEKGIEFFIKPDLSKLSDSGIWKDAAVQIFYSLSASWGGLIALSSYNRFHNDAMRDAFTISISNCLTSVFAGFVIFSYLGHLAHVLGVEIDEVAKSGPSLVFVVYPYAVTKLPVAPFWSIVFFLMLVTLGLDSAFAQIETVLTGLMDRFQKLRQYKFLLAGTVCSLFFLSGLTMTTEGGIYMLQVMDSYCGSWSILFIAICECISISYVYGFKRFLQDIETMVGKNVCGCLPFHITKFWWALNWCLITPALVAFIMIFSWVKYTGLEGEKFPYYADILGWMMSFIALVSFVGGALLARNRSGSFREALKPSKDWGPVLVRHRRLVGEYIPDFVVNPWRKQSRAARLSSPNIANFQVMYDQNGLDNDQEENTDTISNVD